METVTQEAILSSQWEQAAAQEELGWSNCFPSPRHQVTAREMKLTFVCFCTQPSDPEVKGYTSYYQSFHLPPLTRLLSLLQQLLQGLEARQWLPPHHPEPEHFFCGTTQHPVKEMFIRRTVNSLDGVTTWPRWLRGITEWTLAISAGNTAWACGEPSFPSCIWPFWVRSLQQLTLSWERNFWFSMPYMWSKLSALLQVLCSLLVLTLEMLTAATEGSVCL